ncbi:MAG TPA: ferritin-like domain-containing protein [Solirubrobacteraceae bacterium]
MSGVAPLPRPEPSASAPLPRREPPASARLPRREPPAGAPLPRRAFLASGAAAALLARPSPAAAQAGGDQDVLTRALRFEQTTLFAYDEVGRSRLLGRGAGARFAHLRAHESSHVAALAKTLAGRGWTAPPPPARVDDVEVPQIRAAIDGLRDRSAALSLLREVEELSIEVHRAALAALREPQHIQLVARLLAAESTHLVAWRAVR